MQKSITNMIYRLRKFRIISETNEYQIRQWMTLQQLSQESDRLSQNLMEYASNYVPYYRELFKTLNINSDSFSKDEWRKIPILSKEKLIDRFEALKSNAPNPPKGYINRSGGSTGNPTTFINDYQQFQKMQAWLDLVYSWSGWKHGEPRLELWGNRTQKLPLTLSARLRAYLSGVLVLPVYQYTESTMDQWWTVINQLKPTLIYGYPSVLADFADWVQSNNYEYNKLKGIYCSAEVLFPQQRDVIEAAFGCKVYNQYGSREVPCIACECPEGGMHVFVDQNRTEFVKTEETHDDSYAIIVTPLFNYVQPLMRYEIGDMGKPLSGSCRCGRGYPLMEINIARSSDILIGSNHSRIFPSFFIRLLDKESWVRAYQFVQKRVDQIDLNLETMSEDSRNAALCAKLAETVSVRIKESMGTNTQCSINIVPKIDRTAAGKHRFVIKQIEE